MNKQNLVSLFPIFLVMFAAVLMRLVPHPPNFTPLIAMGLFGVVMFKDKRVGFFVPILVMLLSDMMLGFHSFMIYVYSALLISSAVGLWLKQNMTAVNVVLSSCASATLFFVITNGAVWMTSTMYAKTFSGLVTCFTMSIPFYHNSLIATVLYSSVMFLSIYVFTKRKLVNAKI